MNQEQLKEAIVEELARTIQAIESGQWNAALTAVRKAHAAIVELERRVSGYPPPKEG